MADQLELRLERLFQDLLSMGKIAQSCVRAAIDAYKQGRSLKHQLRSWSDQLREIQSKIEDECVEVLGRYQPMASDLRKIRSCMKIGYDFNRLGRYAWDISCLLDLFSDTSRCIDRELEDLMERTQHLLEMAFRALAEGNSELARAVDREDSELDRRYSEYLRELVRRTNAEQECLILNALFARYLERIGDHACYIAESIIYMVEGKML